ncbi:hypothetical protein ACFFVB_12040 [Formosa undariae]|uniref:DUF2946 domain-containing protein n=1 Tax=Formosa undariae TaxID=1325436 RepID=A0ABV5F2Y8_9FLAO
MKFLAYILAFMVLSLSVKSGNDELLLTSEVQKPCCAISSAPVSETENTEHQKSKGSTDNCNPFKACCSCLLVSFNYPFSLEPYIAISTEQFFGYQSYLASQFISDFWQPPQFV